MIKYSRNQNTIASKLDDELVMIDIDLGKYFALNPIASRIWEIIERPKTIDEICTQLKIEFEVDDQTCLADVTKFLGELISMKIALAQK